MDKKQFAQIFTKLKPILSQYQAHLDCVTDLADQYYLNTTFIQKNRKPIFFGAVKISKNYVSFHLMPVYIFPELLYEVSDELKQRMQGKSCFNFKEIDESLFSQLNNLTKKSFQKFKKAGYL